MRLTTVLLIASLMHVSAAGLAQKLTLEKRNVDLKTIFADIRKQTGYLVLYSPEQVKDSKRISLSIKDEPLTQALIKILKDQNLQFEIEDKSIIIKEAEPSFLDNLVARFSAIDVRGIVVDSETGNALSGASVKVKGTNRVTTTGSDGAFYLRGVNEDAVIEISFIGYVSQELKAKKDLGDIRLVLNNSKLDEIQVIAYGTTTRRLSTSNLGSIKAETIQRQPITNPLLALQGRIPGLIVTQQSGISGSNIQVQIQGKNSIQSGNDPFYVIDGVPFSSRMLPTSVTILSGTGSPFSYLNPNDIESIEILKDADATSIYGSRAANGAILITTKKGKAGKSQIDLSFQQGWGKVPKKVDLLNTQQYLDLRKEAKRNDNLQISATDYDINGVWDTTRNVDWQKELIGNTANFTNARATISGGTNEIQFLIGSGYIKETSIFPGEFNDTKGSLDFSIQHTSSNKKFSIQLSGNYLSGNNKLPSIDLTGTALSLAPNAPSLFTADGSLNFAPLPNGVSTFANPAGRLLQKYQNKTNNLIGNSVLSYEILSGFKIKTNLGYNVISSKEQSIVPIIAFDPNSTFKQRSASYIDKSNTAIIVEPQLEYYRDFNFGKLNILLGSTYTENRSFLTALSGTGYNSDIELDNVKSAGSITVSNSIQSKYRYNAAFTRINYSYNNKYIINLTARRDGSSRFGSENQFHNFFSTGAAWIFSEENIVKKQLKFISFGKVRMSYGTTGNDQIPDYAYLNLFSPLTSGITVPYQGAVGSSARGHSNPLLQWELTKKFNAGLELGLYDNKILFNANYFINTSTNQLLQAPLPIQTGFNIIQRNLPATVRNEGLEASLEYSILRNKELTWNSSINFTVPKNRLLSFPNLAQTGYSSSLIVGQPITTIKAFDFHGINAQTGAYQFLNSNGQVVSTPNSLTDKLILINIDPKFYGGWNNSITYSKFHLDFLIQFNKQSGLNDMRFGSFAGFFNINQPVSSLDRWRNSGDGGLYQRANSTASLSTAESNARLSDEAYTDLSNLSLRNVSLSYDIPEVFTSAIHINSASLFILGQNLLTLTKFKGLNPETGSNVSVPPLRVVTFGMRVNL